MFPDDDVDVFETQSPAMRRVLAEAARAAPLETSEHDGGEERARLRAAREKSKEQMMSQSSANLFAPDRLVHQPARLAILTVLTASRMADLLFLQTMTGLTQGNVSSHLAALEEAGLVVVTRTIRRKRPYTTVRVTSKGRLRYAAYWRDLDAWREQFAEGRFTFRDRMGPE